MNDERASFELARRDRDDPAPVLQSVQVEGRLDGVLFEQTLRQTYRNACAKVLEVVYTFPLPPQAVLLGFGSELNGVRKDGVIVPRREAEREYEESLEQGDAPVMLEATGAGLYTANIGNLKPGDEMVLECRFAQLLSVEQGRIRVAIPTTIAPRFGRPEAAGIQPQQIPQVSLGADYRLDLNVTIGPALAGAMVDCPTHRFVTRPAADGATRLTLAEGARLDRDVVLAVTPAEPRPSLVVRAQDGFSPASPVVLMAALQPPLGHPCDRIALKALVDCSGSMNGDSIASARAALHGILDGLAERDSLSLSRFGSSVEHLFGPAAVTATSQAQLPSSIDRLQADLGGTDMEGALEEVFGLSYGPEHARADVLLITDGEIWQADEMIAAARRSGHRVFAVGVGSAPAEGVLRDLAESTGGACEFATPGEALEAAAIRMVRRMRQPVYTNARIEWGGTPVWSSSLGKSHFGGDTVIAFGGFLQAPAIRAIRLLADDATGRTVELARGETEAPAVGDGLPRLAAARLLSDAGSIDADLAVRYQLMTRDTNCILVHRRDDASKSTEPAELHRVGSMLAAGWGGMGSVIAAPQRSSLVSRAMFAEAPVFDSMFDSIKFCPVDAPAAPEAGDELDHGQEPATLGAIARVVKDHFVRGGSLDGLSASFGAVALHAAVQQALGAVIDLGVTHDQAWLLLAHWVNVRDDGLADTDLANVLQPFVSDIDPGVAETAASHFTHELGRYGINGWTTSRAERLQRALGGITT